jgi:hypothetical protein
MIYSDICIQMYLNEKEMQPFTLFVQQSDKESCRDEVNTVGLHFFFI